MLHRRKPQTLSLRLLYTFTFTYTFCVRWRSEAHLFQWCHREQHFHKTEAYLCPEVPRFRLSLWSTSPPNLDGEHRKNEQDQARRLTYKHFETSQKYQLGGRLQEWGKCYVLSRICTGEKRVNFNRFLVVFCIDIYFTRKTIFPIISKRRKVCGKFCQTIKITIPGGWFTPKFWKVLLRQIAEFWS